MEYILLRNEIHCEKGIGFWRWLPVGTENALKLTIDGIHVCVYVDLPNAGGTIGGIELDDIPKGNHWISRIVVLLEVPVESASDPIWYSMDVPPDDLDNIADAWRVFESTFLATIRNEIGQYWLPNSHEIESIQSDELLTGIRIWDREEEEWKQFCKGVFRAESPIPAPDILIDSQRWLRMGDLIEKSYRTDLSKVFVRNAQQYLAQGDHRMALVEACVALERAISVSAPTLLRDAETRTMASILNGDSLTDKVRSVLPMLLASRNDTSVDVRTCTEAVSLRNLVIHKACVHIERSKARELIRTVDSVVRTLNGRVFREISGRKHH